MQDYMGTMEGQRLPQQRQQKLLSPRQFNKHSARSLSDFRKITKTHGVQGVRRQQSPPQHWHNGLRSYDKHPKERNFRLSARDVMYKTRFVQHLETKTIQGKGPAPSGYGMLGRETQQHIEVMKQQPTGENQMQQQIVEEGMDKGQNQNINNYDAGDNNGMNDNASDGSSNGRNVDNNNGSKYETNLYANASLKERFDNIKSKVHMIGNFNNKLAKSQNKVDDAERKINEELMQLDQRLKFIKDKSPKGKRAAIKRRNNEKHVKQMLRDDKKRLETDDEEEDEYQPTFTELEPNQKKLYLMTLHPRQRELLLKTLDSETSKLLNEEIANHKIMTGNTPIKGTASSNTPINDELHQAVVANWKKKQSSVDTVNTKDEDENNQVKKDNVKHVDDQDAEIEGNRKNRSPSIPPPAPPSPPPIELNDDNHDSPPPIPPFVAPPGVDTDSDNSDSSSSSSSSDEDDEYALLANNNTLPPDSPESVDSDIPPPPVAPPPPLKL